MTRFARGVMETQNWWVKLKVVVADARREFIPWDASARAFQPGSGAHLRICLGKLDSRLTCSLVASPLSADSSLPPLSLFSPPAIPSRPLPPPIPPTPVSIPFGVSTPRRSPRRRISLSPGYFSLGLRSHCHVRIPWGPRIGPLSLSVNASFASSFLRLPERKRKRN